MSAFIIKDPPKWENGNLVLTNFPKHGRHWSWDEKIPNCWVSKFTVGVLEFRIGGPAFIEMTIITPVGDMKRLEFDLRIPFDEKIAQKFSDTMGSRKTFDILLK